MSVFLSICLLKPPHFNQQCNRNHVKAATAAFYSFYSIVSQGYRNKGRRTHQSI